VVGLTFAAGAEASALPAGVLPVDAQPASRLALKSMANKRLLLSFIGDLHQTGLAAGIGCYMSFIPENTLPIMPQCVVITSPSIRNINAIYMPVMGRQGGKKSRPWRARENTTVWREESGKAYPAHPNSHTLHKQ
jgi:hypothetical protein